MLDWTDDVCEKADDGYTSHHMVPKRDGGTPLHPLFVQTCRYCGLTEKQVRERMAARG